MLWIIFDAISFVASFFQRESPQIDPSHQLRLYITSGNVVDLSTFLAQFDLKSLYNLINNPFNIDDILIPPFLLSLSHPQSTPAIFDRILSAGADLRAKSSNNDSVFVYLSQLHPQSHRLAMARILFAHNWERLCQYDEHSFFYSHPAIQHDILNSYHYSSDTALTSQLYRSTLDLTDNTCCTVGSPYHLPSLSLLSHDTQLLCLALNNLIPINLIPTDYGTLLYFSLVIKSYRCVPLLLFYGAQIVDLPTQQSSFKGTSLEYSTPLITLIHLADARQGPQGPDWTLIWQTLSLLLDSGMQLGPDNLDCGDNAILTPIKFIALTHILHKPIQSLLPHLSIPHI